MKTILYLTLCFLCVCTEGCGTVKIADGDFAPPYLIYILGDPDELLLPPGDPLAVKLENWIRSHPSGWRRVQRWDKPSLVIRNDRFYLFLVDETALLNFKPDDNNDKWIHLNRPCNSNDLSLLIGEVVRKHRTETGR